MDELSKNIPALIAGFSLSAACGFRIFLPLLCVSAALNYGYVTPLSHIAWLATREALTVLSIATIVELVAFYIPIIDNFLDTLAAPLSIVAGTLIMGTVLDDVDPIYRWTIGIMAGGGPALLTQSTTSAIRLTSTSLSGGGVNFLVATLESIFGVGIVGLVLYSPTLALILVCILLCAMAVILFKSVKFIKRNFSNRQPINQCNFQNSTASNISSSSKFCFHCGVAVSNSDLFCFMCGRNIN